jgi:HlyD family secretion protein
MATVHPFTTDSPSTTGVADNADPTSFATVVRQDLSSQTEVAATLGYASNYSVVNQAQGTVTALPAVGQVVTQGQVLYRVNGNPVVLLYGTTPAYRSLSEGASASDVTGTDVAELNVDLVALGYANSAEIPAGTDEFTWGTKGAVEKLQAALGVTQTGTLTLGQAAFLPTAARVTTVSATLGAPAQSGQPVLTATSTTRQVSIALDADQQSEVAVGDKVTITLPNNQSTPGVISSVGTVATAPAAGSSDSTPTIIVSVNPTDPSATGSWDQAPVDVTITTATAHGALVVPVDALLALAGGGYAIEVSGADGLHHLVAVTLGLFDDADGLVQVTGSGLAAGQHVVVPAT